MEFLHLTQLQIDLFKALGGLTIITICSLISFYTLYKLSNKFIDKINESVGF